MAVADTKVPLFKDHFWHFQIKRKFWKKILKQGSVRILDTDFFWIIPSTRSVNKDNEKSGWGVGGFGVFVGAYSMIEWTLLKLNTYKAF